MQIYDTWTLQRAQSKSYVYTVGTSMLSLFPYPQIGCMHVCCSSLKIASHSVNGNIHRILHNGHLNNCSHCYDNDFFIWIQHIYSSSSMTMTISFTLSMLFNMCVISLPFINVTIFLLDGLCIICNGKLSFDWLNNPICFPP